MYVYMHIHCAAHKFHILLQYFIAVGLKTARARSNVKRFRALHARTRRADSAETREMAKKRIH